MSTFAFVGGLIALIGAIAFAVSEPTEPWVLWIAAGLSIASALLFMVA